ncbi:hypothetical protein HYPSUDRAFT_1067035 [Hypholoma sublateritium FD-334 SS-4]|uniref:Pumilio homology domain family member 3 n=1 Tax=Hypholoma sublateritium (strain FD-334 SS-4) TaxID=945553 RepID=A0A0D2P5Y3_HYPSF|nr:hypothetical protein HYPSUDRAFT_1067035 [Hypholoma sublateritium FD-334 SS-4]
MQTTPTSGNARLSYRTNNPSRPPRSVLLEEFRKNRDKNWVLEDMLGHVVEFSGDQHGSRFIQQQLEQASNEEKDMVFREIAPHNINNLIQHVFGNYVIQKFFDLGSEHQINILTNAVEEQVEHLSLNIYGCRVVQKALETISPTQQSSMIRRLDSSILHCIKDAHGNHVVQKLVEVVAPERLTFLLAICDNILELSTQPYGCRVLQRCLEHLPTEHTRPLLDAINRYTEDLMKDQYGNYVIQFILEQGQDCDKAVIFADICGSLIRLAQHKYASNVCEKALMCADSERREILINEIMTAKPRTSGENPILTMVKDQYANYVLQRALTLSEGQQRVSFFHLVKPLLASLRKLSLTYSRPLVSNLNNNMSTPQVERLMDKYFNQPTTVDSPEDIELA